MEHDCASALELRRAAVLNSNNLAAMSSPAIKSSNVDDEGRPRPQFFTESVTFSTKKEKATPRSIVPPRPPIKSCPPVSRLRPVRKNENEGARVVSFVNNDINNSLIRVKSITSNNDENDDSNQGGSDDSIAKKNLYFEQSFVIEEYLGSGSFGKVYKVRSKEDGKYYAVKKSKEKYKGTSDRKRRLEEVAKHEELPQHPNFVRFYRAWEEKQRLYIQIELCQMSLSSYAANNHDIPEDTIWRFLVDLLNAVKHLHDRDLVHMDIKPDNIFVSFDGVCKLGDFGLVIDLKKDDLREVQEGDPKYLAPEVLVGSHNITTAVDIFSLGMSILELATDLDLPRGGEPWHKLRNGQIPEHLTAALSDRLVQIICSMIDPDHKRRATAVQLLADVYVKRRMSQQRRHELLVRLVEKVKKSAQFFYSIIVRSKFMRPLIFSCRFILTGFGFINWLGKENDNANKQQRSVVENRKKKTPDLEISNSNSEQDGSIENDDNNNNTSTPNKTDPDANGANGGLLGLSNEEQDEDSVGKIRKYMSKLRKCDQYDYKLLNLIQNNNNENSNDPSPLYDSYDDDSSSESSSDFSDSKSRSTNSRDRYGGGVVASERKASATALKLEFSPTSISPSTNKLFAWKTNNNSNINNNNNHNNHNKRCSTEVKSCQIAYSTTTATANRNGEVTTTTTTTTAATSLSTMRTRPSSKNFTRQKLNFDDYND